MEMLEHVNKFHFSNERIATRQCGTLRLISRTQITSSHAYGFPPSAFARISKEQFNRVSELWREQQRLEYIGRRMPTKQPDTIQIAIKECSPIKDFLLFIFIQF